ncbi:DUF2064 domain-containing protein [Agreia pratensis]|uniref:Glycosyltransferase n=1 Tax=Agreia pratensis TaxID=150121 RepID=A0A1X7IZS2_9MICO|nr:DUF2064 domain-containing protein [Agreia pratensis]MBF4636128.1 DUF2064 domain-containing protein [Agreia pratensis]SMG20888.1 hypothetical protein SAMN06296010_1081 [Agreia pratensis]
MLTIAVIAKECIPGRVKTRLHPPFSLVEAAEIASASLGDTLDVVSAVPADRRILFFDGENPPAEARGFEILHQNEGTLDERLGYLFDSVDGPLLMIGMDTPQVTRELLEPVITRWHDDIDAWFGFASDGGFWALGMREPDGSLIRGVAMSEAETGRDQLERLLEAEMRVKLLAEINDVDSIDDARDVAAIAPDGRFAEVFDRVSVRAGVRDLQLDRRA